MRPSKPPAVATWLLIRFLSGPEDEHIVGDLMEAYQGGRSRVWYWKEVIAAVTSEAYAETTDHPILFIRTIALGWTILLLWDYAVGPALAPLIRHFMRFSGYPFGPSMLIWFAIALVDRAGSGWAVARFSRGRKATAVFLFATSAFIFHLRSAAGLWLEAANALTNTRFVPYLIYGLELQFVLPAAILFGGLFLASPLTREGNLAKPSTE